MKARRVFVTLEIDTCVPLKDLRSVKWWAWKSVLSNILQAQANVAQCEKKPRKKAKRKA